MGARTVYPLCVVAVSTQELKATRVIVIAKPSEYLNGAAYLAAVLCAIVLDVVDLQELPMSITAALAHRRRPMAVRK